MASAWRASRPGYASSATRLRSPSCSPGRCAPAASSNGTPACIMKATGGLTHFMLGLEPAGPSVARRANLAPAGRAAQKAAKAARTSLRPRLA